MASYMEVLPTELLEPILSSLDMVHVARLRQCNKGLEKRLEPYLFSFPLAVNKFMQWACINGEVRAIEKALAYGADVSVADGPYCQVSTLYLTTRRHHYEAFKFLLDSGARLDLVDLDWTQSRPLRKRLFHPLRPRFLQLCYEHAVTDQIDQFQTGIDEALVASVKAGYGIETYQIWLDLGANPTAVVGNKAWRAASALSLAILSGSVPLTQFFLSRKPDLSSPSVDLPYSPPRLHLCPSYPWKGLPMLAAARHMAAHGTVEMMNLCLDAGGDINQSVESFMNGFCKGPLTGWTYPVTPLMTFLLSVDFTLADEDTKLSPHQGLQYLIDKGATVEVSWPDSRTSELRPLEPLPKLLWTRWDGMRSLVNTEIYAMLETLIQLDTVKGHVYSFLIPSDTFPPFMLPPYMTPPDGAQVQPCCETHDPAREPWYQRCFIWNGITNRGAATRWEAKEWAESLGAARVRKVPLCGDDYALAADRWRKLLDLVLRDDHFDDGLARNIDDLFFELLMKLMGSALQIQLAVPNLCWTEPISQHFDESHPVTIQKLLEKGADIKANSSKDNRYFHSTILEAIAIAHSPEHATVLGDDWRYFKNKVQIPKQRSFVSMLVSLGAEPPLRALEENKYTLNDRYRVDTPLHIRWLSALRGDVVEEERLLWNPTSSFLIDGSWKKGETGKRTQSYQSE